MKIPFREIKKIVEYLWQDEIRDFVESEKKDHIYYSLVKVKDWLEQIEKKTT